MATNGDTNFYDELFRRQQHKESVPSNDVVAKWARRLICVLYPEQRTCVLASRDAVIEVMEELEIELEEILTTTLCCRNDDNTLRAKRFFEQVPEILRLLNTDIEAIVAGDPAANTRFEVIRAYPGFHALSFYRIAHTLHSLGVCILPRILTEYAHSQTGIDIHPAAEIDEYFCIDHGTGIVIGETTVIGKHVKIYQGVTLGALSVNKLMANSKRHPTVEDHVVIYSNASILGGETIIGHHSVIGGNAWLTESVPPGTLVYHQPEITIVKGKYLPA